LYAITNRNYASTTQKGIKSDTSSTKPGILAELKGSRLTDPTFLAKAAKIAAGFASGNGIGAGLAVMDMAMGHKTFNNPALAIGNGESSDPMEVTM
jgi:hypothetical protein